MADQSWAKHVADVLRRNGIRLFVTVPDYIGSHVLDELWADAECRVVTTTREEEAVGLLSNAWLAGTWARPRSTCSRSPSARSTAIPSGPWASAPRSASAWRSAAPTSA